MTLKNVVTAKPFWAIVGVVLFLLAALSYNIRDSMPPDHAEGQRHWNNICKKVRENQVKGVQINLRSDMYDFDLGGLLSESDFLGRLGTYVSPPTPYYGTLFIEFADGTTAWMGNWGDETFSVALGLTYYLIQNKELYDRITQLREQLGIPSGQ